MDADTYAPRKALAQYQLDTQTHNTKLTHGHTTPS